jgi:hypothetical protein
MYIRTWRNNNTLNNGSLDGKVRGLLRCGTFLGQPLCFSGQSPWLQIQRTGFDSRSYKISWEVVGLERGPLGLVSITEEVLERKSIGSGLESRECGRRDPSRWPRGTLYPQNLELTSPTSGDRSVGIVRSRIQATESVCCLWDIHCPLYQVPVLLCRLHDVSELATTPPLGNCS